MLEQQNTHNQPPVGPLPPQGQMVPPGLMLPGLMPPGAVSAAVPPPPAMRKRPAPRGWRERWMRRFGMDTTVPLKKGALTLPDWLTGRAIIFFFVTMLVCWGAYGYIPNFDLVLISCISIVVFFYGGFLMAKSWKHIREKDFLQKIFVSGFIVRLIWVLYLYFMFNPEYYGNTFGDTADVTWYMPFGETIAQWIERGFDRPFSELRDVCGAAIDDTGYPIWLGLVYFLTNHSSDVLIPFILKCLMGAYCSISMYQVARRHFGEGAARITAIFVCLNPNMMYWCGSMFKEAEMVFLVCFAIDSFDKVLTSGKRYTFRALLPGMLAATALMFFRSVLGLVIFIAVFSHIVMASQRVMSVGKKVLAGVLVATILALSMGDRIRTQSQQLLHAAQSDQQHGNMEWRAEREGGNSFAKYASAAVFAPLIFSIPFPTFNQANEHQLSQVQLSGGSYIKNILSFFVILVMFMMLISGEWRQHVFILAYTCGYLMVLVMSNFAQSGRFHMPVWPMLMLFAAYGVQIAKSNVRVRKWFPLVLVLEIVVCLAWNWFKLKGRGMI